MKLFKPCEGYSATTFWRRWLLVVLVGLVAGFVVDMAVMNYQALESRFFSDVPPQTYRTASSADGSISNRQALEFSFDEDNDIRSFSITLTRNEGEFGKKRVPVRISLLDDASALYREIDDSTLKIGSSYYYRIHPSGTLHGLKVEVDGVQHAGMVFATVDFNAPKPFKPNPFLWIAGIVLACVACALRPSSLAWNIRFQDAKGAIILIGCLMAIVLGLIAGSHTIQTTYDSFGQMRYDNLAQAFLEGHAFINEEPSAELLALENPYDVEERLASEADYCFDYALYDGKYYVYFGVLPCLLFFLPFRALTGAAFPLLAAALIAMLLLLSGMMRLAYVSCRRFFPTLSLAHFIIVLIAMLLGSWVTYIGIVPDAYNLPIALALALLAWGLSFCIIATEGSGQMPLVPAVMGALLLSLTVATRPQMLAGGILALFLAGAYAKRNGLAAVAKPLALSIVVVLAVFALQGWYNAIRFSGPFDFGASYNLTTNDMRVRGFELDRTPLAIIAYLLQPPHLQADAPFFSLWFPDSQYYGTIIAEGFLAGIFPSAPILLVVFALAFRRYRRTMRGELKVLCTCSLAIALLVMLFDANAAGMLTRYFSDFGFYLAFASMLCIGEFSKKEPLVENEGRPQYTLSGMVLVILAMSTVFMQIPSTALLY